uniref:Uncharacterized protein n=1 Tax=Arundo donax TaxID=35708 RepID=A0A0A9CK22_ARUDO
MWSYEPSLTRFEYDNFDKIPLSRYR